MAAPTDTAAAAPPADTASPAPPTVTTGTTAVITPPAFTAGTASSAPLVAGLSPAATNWLFGSATLLVLLAILVAARFRPRALHAEAVRDTSLFEYYFNLLPALGALVLFLFGLSAYSGMSWQYPLTALAILYSLAGAAVVAGGILGGLFAVPTTTEDDAFEYGSPLRPNTNLEKVSEWLTKVLIGATLAEGSALWRSLSGALKPLAQQFSTLGNNPATGEPTLSVLTFSALFYFVWGFVSGYLNAPRLMVRLHEVYGKPPTAH